MSKHRGKFKWRKYSRYNGNLRAYWQMRHRKALHAKDD